MKQRDKASILYVSHRSNLSGAPVSLLLLAMKMAERDYRVGFMVPRIGPLFDRYSNSSVKLYTVRGSGLCKERYGVQVAAHLSRERFNLVHLNTYKSAYASRIARRMRIPIVWHIREDWKSIPLLKRELICRVSDTVLVPSQDARERCDGARGRFGNTIRVIANGIDVADTLEEISCSRAEKRSALGMNDASVLFLMVASLVPRKGADLYIRVCARLARCLDHVRFILVGESFPGWELYARNLRRLVARSGLGERFTFIASRPDVIELIHASDVVVLPSRWEGMPRILLESMALSRPVVASNIGGNSELIEGGLSGLLVEPDSEEHLLTALGELASDRLLREEIGRAGQERVNGHYSLDRHCDAISQIYREILE